MCPCAMSDAIFSLLALSIPDYFVHFMYLLEKGLL